MIFNNQKESFLYYLREMNIEMIENILPDNCVCFGVSKKTFIDFLYKSFEFPPEFKQLFQLYKHKKKDEYFFHQKGSYCDNRIIITEKNGVITALINNYDAIAKLHENDGLPTQTFYFHYDLRLDFVPDAEYMYFKEECKLALFEVADKPVSENEIIEWVNKYYDVYEITKSKYYAAYEEFNHKHSWYSLLIEVLQHAHIAREGIIDYYLSTDDYKIDWHNNYLRFRYTKSIYFDKYWGVVDRAEKIVCEGLTDKESNKKYYRGQKFLDYVDFAIMFDKQFIFYNY
jgi:hypothetical protein